ncbi:MAG: MotA/TolQ/ExbB proton channel family protein [Myxococcales bacterium]|nr:MotA/TolQ/ExbB proton channel family protein [Myxococcales bacterium]MCB9693870.1 MotA/TolQ/ExbB proton channel family protein [Alphaproteobacteria bacterium]
MQIVGLAMLAFVVSYGFADRHETVISAFDGHAAVMVLGGSLSAILVSSSVLTAVRTFTALREAIPGAGTLGKGTDRLEGERTELVQLWRDGRRAQAVELAQRSEFPVMRTMLDLVMDRAPEEATTAAFTEVRHSELSRWQPAVANWELLSKLAPSFGMVGTITGMIQLFKNMGENDMNIGAAMSLALLATLYGVAFGAGVAGPIGHLLRGLLDERLGAVDRCEQSVAELVARSRS